MNGHACVSHFLTGVVAVGALSTHIDENILNKALYFQSALNNELSLLMDRLAKSMAQAKQPQQPPQEQRDRERERDRDRDRNGDRDREKAGEQTPQPVLQRTASAELVSQLANEVNFSELQDENENGESDSKAATTSKSKNKNKDSGSAYDRWIVSVQFLLEDIELTAGLAPPDLYSEFDRETFNSGMRENTHAHTHTHTRTHTGSRSRTYTSEGLDPRVLRQNTHASRFGHRW